MHRLFLHSGHHSRHLLYTDCPASFPLLLAQWAHTSSFYATVGLYPHLLIQGAPPKPSTVHKLSSFIFSLTCTVVPYLLIFCHSGPIPPIFLHSGQREMRLDSVCTADFEGGAHCVRKRRCRPTLS